MRREETVSNRMLDQGELDERTHPDLKPPAFADPAEERAHRKARLAGACRIFSRSAPRAARACR